jgi:hypothetical protein
MLREYGVCEHPRAMAAHRLFPAYRSGDAFSVEVGGVRFGFSAADFTERVGAAAARLGLVPREEQGPGELQDLVALAAHGSIAAPASPLAAHLATLADQLGDACGDLVHWLRRLVFREAWIDAQIADGRVRPEFRAPEGFRYRSAATGLRIPEGSPPPDLSAAAYRRSG